MPRRKSRLPAGLARGEAPCAGSTEGGDPSDSGVESLDAPGVHGFLHRPAGPAAPTGDGLVLVHGAGSTCRTPLLAVLAGALAARGWLVLRCDLPFRQRRPSGPPGPGDAVRDREGLRRALDEVARRGAARRALGGHSYGGRQASVLAAEAPGLVAGLLLLAYPLHPPGRPGDLRTAHFPRLRTPALFVHGTADPFAAPAELRAAAALVPAPTACLEIEGAGHDLAGRRPAPAALATLAARIADAFLALLA